jgi:hypothetical protein
MVALGRIAITSIILAISEAGVVGALFISPLKKAAI